MLGFDLYAIESGDLFEELNRRCFNCSSQEACAVDLRRDPTSPVWETYCPNAAILGEWPRSGRSHTDLRRAREVGAGCYVTTGLLSAGDVFRLLFFFRHSIRFVTAIARKRDGAELLAQLVTVGWVGRRQLLGLYF